MALDDRLLFVGPDPAGRSEAAPQHLLLAQRAGRRLARHVARPGGCADAIGPTGNHGLWLDTGSGAVILSYQNDRREADSHTRIYRVPLAGGDLTLLAQVPPDSPILPHRPSDER